MADMESVVSIVTTEASRITAMARPARSRRGSAHSPIPACPTTQDRRRNSMTPQMLSRHRTYERRTSTPWIHPNLVA
ncbi:unnamed protein product, partial [Ixodes hexagonus]